MKKKRIGINGFGRMGRLGFRAAWESEDFEIVHINEIKGGSKLAAHLLEFDSVHGRWAGSFDHDDESITINGTRIPFVGTNDLTKLPLDGIDVVISRTGGNASKVHGTISKQSGSRAISLASAGSTCSIPASRHRHRASRCQDGAGLGNSPGI